MEAVEARELSAGRKIKLILKLKTIKVDRYNVGFRSSYSEPHFSEWKLAMTNAPIPLHDHFLGFKIFNVIHFLEWLCCLIKSEDSYQERYKKAKQVAEETPDANFVSRRLGAFQA